MLEGFSQILQQVCTSHPLHPSLSDPDRQLTVSSYLSLFLFGLFNPVVGTMRALCQASRLERVQREICGRAVSLGSFSAMQHVLDPGLLREVLQQLLKSHPGNAKADTRLVHLNLVAQDGSLWRALPRMAWAEYGVGRTGEAKGVRLHLRFHLVEGQPVDARVTRGKDCERQQLRHMCVAGQTNVGDRYYGEDYQLFGELDAAQAFFVFRLKEEAVVNTLEELPLSREDCACGVVRHAWVRLGAREKTRSMRLRLVEIKTADQHLLLVSNLSLEKASAALVGLIYRRRWSIELFFRWIKCILGCRHFFAESPAGVAIQLYLALIASLLFQAYTGQRPSKRIFELIRFYLMGWASADELARLLSEHLQREQARKKT
jgi:Transposase DDE domain